MMMFAILFGLSMDYEVFLLSRIREECLRTGDNGTAVADGLAAHGPGHHRRRRHHDLRLRLASCSATCRVLKLFGLGLAVAVLRRRHHRPHGARAGHHGAARRAPTGGSRSGSTASSPHLDVEGDPEPAIDLTAPEETPVPVP